MTAAVSRPPSRSVIEAVEQAEREHQWTHGWGCTCGNSGGDPEHIRAAVAKAAMDAARPIILREAAALLRREYGSGHAGAVAWIEDRAAKAYEIDADDRSK